MKEEKVFKALSEGVKEYVESHVEDVRFRLLPYQNGMESTLHGRKVFIDVFAAYYILMRKKDSPNEVVITIGRSMGFNEEELWSHAMRNMENDFVSFSLGGLPFLEGASSDVPVAVFTSTGVSYGACQMLNKKALKSFAEASNEDVLVVIPSSVHEILVAPRSAFQADMVEANKMVQFVNKTQVAPKDVLSNHVYQYDRKADSIVIPLF